MEAEKTIKKISLEEKIVLAVKSIVDQFFERPAPNKIFLCNNTNNNFKKVLEAELIKQNYDIKVVDSEEKGYLGGYVINVSKYLNQDNYPRRLI